MLEELNAVWIHLQQDQPSEALVIVVSEGSACEGELAFSRLAVVSRRRFLFFWSGH